MDSALTEWCRYHLDQFVETLEQWVPADGWAACAGDSVFEATIPTYAAVRIGHDHRSAAVAIAQRQGDRVVLRVRSFRDAPLAEGQYVLAEPIEEHIVSLGGGVIPGHRVPGTASTSLCHGPQGAPSAMVDDLLLEGYAAVGDAPGGDHAPVAGAPIGVGSEHVADGSIDRFKAYCDRAPAPAGSVLDGVNSLARSVWPSWQAPALFGVEWGRGGSHRAKAYLPELGHLRPLLLKDIGRSPDRIGWPRHSEALRALSKLVLEDADHIVPLALVTGSSSKLTDSVPLGSRLVLEFGVPRA